ncbi:hypothetical protein A2926_02010 [Candidatus Giovannonibacteria bacterium RIFCSPLOWO2_01_FULL_44_40]|uniref:Acylneuraminate cytidylyltransferase n=1 Tax=Candidatus Giovannonibacteria bacterium RIFCSPHIGHO2_01_FULL_45_23 TaxID=1798325 RepID=A0A1F5VHR8_9BACT|nr:MAG: hypothetical protein A2834_03380 [Candidatus Giovannonibacteria bacterium RIFCSPHIGHO2_01_FULL_45_23]OGF76930.1 MAG: hypothetical protein A3C77_04870 [Candidatus Giovannonibacteria bacterium RIFCSPHIGHO2_02_FULL_45_13]OGF80301.1 MAG: hypothetical protein A2926_02010 [Candidatus Giovannonibacteria bacterium RIFCSPLOWO2_01_FULL_44_40]
MKTRDTKKKELLAIIPARAGSTRVPNKNIRPFGGKPLIAYTILQARENPFIDRVIVDTDSPKIAAIAKKYGAEVPYLRPKRLATCSASVNDAILLLLQRLERDENYKPTHFILLQTTSPLREHGDIQACWDLMNSTDATTVLTIMQTNPRFYHLDSKQNIILVNRPKGGAFSPNTQDWRPGYVLNGCFVYIVKTPAFLKEKNVYTKNTKAVVCDRWRSVDIDYPEDFALAEYLYKNKSKLARRIQNFK